MKPKHVAACCVVSAIVAGVVGYTVASTIDSRRADQIEGAYQNAFMSRGLLGNRTMDAIASWQQDRSFDWNAWFVENKPLLVGDVLPNEQLGKIILADHRRIQK